MFGPSFRICYAAQQVHGKHTTTPRVETVPRILSCQLKFGHESAHNPKVKGSNSAPGSRKEKNVIKKAIIQRVLEKLFYL